MKKMVSQPLRDMHPYARRELARKCGISYKYLSKLMYDVDALPSPKLAVRLERYSDGAVLREQMRPDVWS